MDLPTYTNIWRIEKRLYKLYDFRLPMPLPVGQIAVFAAIAVPYVVILKMIGLPFSHTLLWLYILPPGALAWLVTRPVLEGKRLPELVVSQVRYLSEPRTWCRMAPLAERGRDRGHRARVAAGRGRRWPWLAAPRWPRRLASAAAAVEPAAAAVEPAAAAGAVVPEPPAAVEVAPERPAIERRRDRRRPVPMPGTAARCAACPRGGGRGAGPPPAPTGPGDPGRPEPARSVPPPAAPARRRLLISPRPRAVPAPPARETPLPGPPGSVPAPAAPPSPPSRPRPW